MGGARSDTRALATPTDDSVLASLTRRPDDHQGSGGVLANAYEMLDSMNHLPGHLSMQARCLQRLPCCCDLYSLCLFERCELSFVIACDATEAPFLRNTPSYLWGASVRNSQRVVQGDQIDTAQMMTVPQQPVDESGYSTLLDSNGHAVATGGAGSGMSTGAAGGAGSAYSSMGGRGRALDIAPRVSEGAPSEERGLEGASGLLDRGEDAGSDDGNTERLMVPHSLEEVRTQCTDGLKQLPLRAETSTDCLHVSFRLAQLCVAASRPCVPVHILAAYSSLRCRDQDARRASVLTACKWSRRCWSRRRATPRCRA
jgi:hypothetical protein